MARTSTPPSLFFPSSSNETDSSHSVSPPTPVSSCKIPSVHGWCLERKREIKFKKTKAGKKSKKGTY